MNALLENLPPQLKKHLQKKTIPTFEKPMLATLTKNHFSDPEWLYEKKLDGVRCLIIKNNNKVFLKSRNDKNLNHSYPEIVAATKKLKINQIIVDGEITALDNGISSFEKLQPRIGVKNPSAPLIKTVKIYIYIFDILYLDGYDITKLPLIKRKSILKQAIHFADPLRYVMHKNKEGVSFFKEACKKGWEGIMAKKRMSAYVHIRSQTWLKFKCIKQQELVIAGYTEPQGSRIGFGALLVGYYKNNALHYAGKVGTGYTDEFLAILSKKLKKLEIVKNPFSNKQAIKDINVHFVNPKLVAEIGFEEWTKDSKLRQPRFLGLREDKNPKEVRKEILKKIVPK